jgi:2-haloacid dehalogenase
MPEEAGLTGVRALTFDVGGTVFDWHHTIREEVQRLAGERGVEVDGARFANEWRRGMFEVLDEVRRHDRPWINADAMHREVLDALTERYAELRLSPADCDALNVRCWHRLRAWLGAAEAIERLRSRYTVVVLTILSYAIVVDSSKHNGISWDGVISCEFLGHYKPQAEAYRAGLKLLGVRPEQAMMVAAHPSDLQAAQRVGMRAGFIPRPDERGEGRAPEPDPSFDVIAEDFPDFASQLGT